MEETAVHSVSPKMMISLVTLFAMRMEQYNAWKDFRTPMQSNCLDTCGKYSHNKDSRFYSNILRWEDIAFLEPHPWSAAWSIRSWMLLNISLLTVMAVCIKYYRQHWVNEVFPVQINSSLTSWCCMILIHCQHSLWWLLYWTGEIVYMRPNAAYIGIGRN